MAAELEQILHKLGRERNLATFSDARFKDWSLYASLRNWSRKASRFPGKSQEIAEGAMAGHYRQLKSWKNFDINHKRSPLGC